MNNKSINDDLFSVYKRIAWLVLTKSMLDDQLRAQYNEKWKALLKPTEDTAKFREGRAGLSRLPSGISQVKLRI